MGLITILTSEIPNRPPSRSGYFSFQINLGEEYVFTKENFTTETIPSYLDPEDDDMRSIKIDSLPLKGVLEKNGIGVSEGDEISSSDLSLGVLVYKSIDLPEESYSDSNMSFSVSDEGSGSFMEASNNVFIDVAYVQNEPPSQVGDNGAEIEVGEEFVFTKASLTSQLVPPYSDPEGNPASRLRIDSLPSVGTLTLSGNNCYQGQIINFSDIELGLFKYKSNQVADSGLGGFSFSVSDTGSEQFKS
tara:strand:- start:385 stop:1122 length:738 start_codon:yes stop_codon:yes gene_type:complete